MLDVVPVVTSDMSETADVEMAVVTVIVVELVFGTSVEVKLLLAVVEVPEVPVETQRHTCTSSLDMQKLS